MTLGLHLFSIGSWTPFDHIFRLNHYPAKGETVSLDMSDRELQVVHFGECSANVAVAAARLGLKVGLGMVVGDDFVESGYEAYLRSMNIDLSGINVVPGSLCGHNYMYFDADGDGFSVSNLGVARDQTGWEAPLETTASARCVVINEMFSDYTLSAICAARNAGALTVINGMIGTAGAMAPAFLRQADILVISEHELRQLLNLLRLTRVSEIHTFGPSRIFATLGRQGSVLHSNGNEVMVPPVSVAKVVDPTGAGDAYVAGTVAGLLIGLPDGVAARVGATLASFVVEAWGCQTNLPDREMLASRYRSAFGEALRWDVQQGF